MHVGGRCLARVDERVDTVNNDLGASKPQHSGLATTTTLREGLRDRHKGKECGQVHIGLMNVCRFQKRHSDGTDQESKQDVQF